MLAPPEPTPTTHSPTLTTSPHPSRVYRYLLQGRMACKKMRWCYGQRMIVEHVVRRGSRSSRLGDDDDDDIDDGSSYIISATALILLYVRLDYSLCTTRHTTNGTAKPPSTIHPLIATTAKVHLYACPAALEASCAQNRYPKQATTAQLIHIVPFAVSHEMQCSSEIGLSVSADVAGPTRRP